LAFFLDIFLNKKVNWKGCGFIMPLGLLYGIGGFLLGCVTGRELKKAHEAQVNFGDFGFSYRK
jgi:hypothetical protein